jgi:hypothetical protein
MPDEPEKFRANPAMMGFPAPSTTATRLCIAGDLDLAAWQLASHHRSVLKSRLSCRQHASPTQGAKWEVSCRGGAELMRRTLGRLPPPWTISVGRCFFV